MKIAGVVLGRPTNEAPQKPLRWLWASVETAFCGSIRFDSHSGHSALMVYQRIGQRRGVFELVWNEEFFYRGDLTFYAVRATASVPKGAPPVDTSVDKSGDSPTITLWRGTERVYAPPDGTLICVYALVCPSTAAFRCASIFD